MSATPSTSLPERELLSDSALAPINRHFQRHWVEPVQVILDAFTLDSLEGPAASTSAIVASQRKNGAWARHPGAPVERGLSVLNHTALALLLRSGALSAEVAEGARAALGRSWKHLAGRIPADEAGLLEPLPRRSTRFTGPVVRGMHAALSAPPTAGLPEPVKEALTLFTTDWDYFTVPEVILGLGALLTAPQLTLGLVVGLTVWNAVETFLHAEHYHADSKRSAALGRYLPAWLNLRVEIGRMQHKQHHAAYAENKRFGTNYAAPIYTVAPEEAMRRRERLEGGVQGRDITWIADEGFGDRFSLISASLYGVIGAPALGLAAAAVAALHGGWRAQAGLFVGYSAGVAFTALVHWCLHRDPHTRLDQVPRWARPVTTSHHFDLAARRHGYHHLGERAIASTATAAEAPRHRYAFNQIAPGPGGNTLYDAWKGTPTAPTPAQRARLGELGF